MSEPDPRSLTWAVPADGTWDENALAVLRWLLPVGLGPGVWGPRPATRGPRWDRTWVDEAVRVDVDEVARLLARPRDLVDACVEVTLREPTWLT